MRPSIAKALLFAACGLAACASEEPRAAHVQETSYCYVSLADVECYRYPVPGQYYRLVGNQPVQ